MQLHRSGCGGDGVLLFTYSTGTPPPSEVASQATPTVCSARGSEAITTGKHDTCLDSICLVSASVFHACLLELLIH